MCIKRAALAINAQFPKSSSRIKMVSADEVFAKIEARLTKLDPAARKNFNNYKLIITNDGGAVQKTWMLLLKDEVKVAVGDGAADCTLTLSEKVLVDIGTGAVSIADAIAQGKITVTGEKDVAVLLQAAVSTL
jgi:putative sterol carrier protein